MCVPGLAKAFSAVLPKTKVSDSQLSVLFDNINVAASIQGLNFFIAKNVHCEHCLLITMTKPAFIRYLPARLNARLRPLGRPAVWIPLTVTALLGAILWENRQNPDWFNRQPITNLNPDSSLTAEEEARLSEIDNLDVLLKGARVSEDTDVVTSQINPDAPIVLDDEVAVSSADAIAKSVSEDYPIPGSPSLTPDSDGRSVRTSAFANVTG